MATVFANNRSILHKGDGHTHVAAPPDVCKVPTPGGPVPTPFVNAASGSALAKGSKNTKIEGNAIAISDSELSTSSGDEPGTAGGLISSKFKGKQTWASVSTDVKVEGKGVARFSDPTNQNGNSFNTAFISVGSATGLAFGDDKPCPLSTCGKPIDAHRVHETEQMIATLGELFARLEEIMNDPLPAAGGVAALVESSPDLTRWYDTHVKPGLSQRKVVSAIAELGILAYGSATPIGADSQHEKIFQALKQIVDGCQGRHVLKGMPLSRFALFQKVTSFAQLKAEEARGGPPGYTVPLAGFVIGAARCDRCGKSFVSHSGTFLSNGFKEAHGKLSSTPVLVPPQKNSFADNERFKGQTNVQGWKGDWSCAASHLLKYMRENGHACSMLSEQFYSPLQYLYRALDKTKVDWITTKRVNENTNQLPPVQIGGEASKATNLKHRPFREVLQKRGGSTESKAAQVTVLHGESMSSCEKCQQFLPGLLCPPFPEGCR